MSTHIRGVLVASAIGILASACATPTSIEPEPAPAESASIESVEVEDMETERYLPRKTPTPAPNSLVMLARPTEPAGRATLSSFQNTPEIAAEMADSSPNPAILSASRARNVSDPIKIHLLNIGAGSCQIVECPDSTDVLIADCGSLRPSVTDMTEARIASFLDDIGVTGEVIVTLSHPHEDHYNRVSQLMGDRTAKSIWLGGEYQGYGGEGAHAIGDWIDRQVARGVVVFEDFDPGFANRGVPVEELRCGSAETYILTVNIGSKPNTQSLVLLVEYGNFRAIFSGDAEGHTEDSAIRNYGALIQDVSVLTSSHHGASSKSSNDTDWAESTSPQVVIFSSGLSHGHPRQVAGERYLQFVFPDVESHEMWWTPNSSGTTPTFDTRQAVYTTEVSGRITVESDGVEFSLSCHKEGETRFCF